MNYYRVFKSLPFEPHKFHRKPIGAVVAETSHEASEIAADYFPWRNGEGFMVDCACRQNDIAWCKVAVKVRARELGELELQWDLKDYDSECQGR